MSLPSSAQPPAVASPTVAGIADYRRVPLFSVSDNAKVLQRYEYVERRMVRLLAGWMPGTARWEAKFLLGRLAWEEAEHTQELRDRILELRTSERMLDRPPSPNLALVLDELVLADDWREFLWGAAAVKRALLAAYEKHLTQTQPLVDQPTVRLLRRMIPEEQEHIRLLEEQAAAGAQEADRRRLEDWALRLTRLIEAAGGIQGIDPVTYTVQSSELRAGTRTFRCDHSYALDERFQNRQVPRFLPGQKPEGEDAAAAYRFIALSRFAEMQAAKGLALSLYENDGQPWEYYYVLARHLWDETRHAAMGMAMLEDQGVDWTQLPHFVGNYHFYASLTPLERTIRLGIIIELNLMESGAKRHEVELARKHKLALAEIFQDYDWADEVNHVEYARRAIDLTASNSPELIDQLVQDVQSRYAEFRKPWEEQGASF
jgi:hypothetical protein